MVLAALAAPSAIPAQEPAATPPGKLIDTYLRAIEDTLSLNGPYAVELVDLYYGYGQSLLEDGDLEGARDAFHRTAMVERVNSGPFSLQQTNYLYSIAQVESLLGNLEESIEVLEHVYDLHVRAYGENDPAMLPVLRQIKEWYERQKPLKAVPGRASDLENIGYFANRIAQLTEASEGLADPATAQQYRMAGQAHFRAIYYILNTGEPPVPELVFNNSGRGAQWYYDRTLSQHFTDGEAAFERAIASWRQNPESTTLDVAEAVAQLADWYLVLRHFNSAEKQYERAWKMLREDEDFRHIADEYFGQPAPLRFLNNEESFVRDLDAPVVGGDFRVIMTVSRSGRLIDIEMVNAPENETEEQLRKFTERLENTRFRPAVVNGEVVRLDRFEWRPQLTQDQLAARDG